MFSTVESCQLALVVWSKHLAESTSNPYLLFMCGYLRRQERELRAIVVKEALLEFRDYANWLRADELLKDIQVLLGPLLDGSMRLDDANLTRVEAAAGDMISLACHITPFEEFKQIRRPHG